jgi:hypothetical protein
MPDREELIQKTKDVCDRNVAIFDPGRSKVWHVMRKNHGLAYTGACVHGGGNINELNGYPFGLTGAYELIV